MYLTEPTDKICEVISEALYEVGSKSGGYGDVYFLDIHQHNVCNHTASGIININGTEYGFIVQCGDWNGFIVEEWGDPEEVGTVQVERPEPHELITFIPARQNSFNDKKIMSLYLLWRDSEWFKKMESSYRYDRHFAPGTKTEQHYRQWAAKKGLTIGYIDELPGDIQAKIKSTEKCDRPEGF